MDRLLRFPMATLKFELKPARHLAEAYRGRYFGRELLMPRRFLVQIDVELLRSHLAEADREAKSPEQIQEFLSSSGFQPTSGGWLVSEADLGVLNADEVISIDEVPEDR
jgi:hypothetical protein